MFGSALHKACNLYAHVTWHTWRRTRAIARSDVSSIVAAANEAAARTGAHLHGIAVLKEHVHIVLSYLPNVALTSFIRHAKSESARRVNLQRAGEGMLRWARGYYAGSLSHSHVSAARIYVGRQYKRHPDLVPE